jgi:hypothetical protein
MASRQPYIPGPQAQRETFPFESAEEAWFWFIQAQEARSAGARLVAGHALLPRPCEPIDILKILDRLYRPRRLLREHLLVLRHYGRRFLAPDPRRIKEVRACTLWREAIERLSVPLERKGIVLTRLQRPGRNWHEHAIVLEGMGA